MVPALLRRSGAGRWSDGLWSGFSLQTNFFDPTPSRRALPLILLGERQCTTNDRHLAAQHRQAIRDNYRHPPPVERLASPACSRIQPRLSGRTPARQPPEECLDPGWGLSPWPFPEASSAEENPPVISTTMPAASLLVCLAGNPSLPGAPAARCGRALRPSQPAGEVVPPPRSCWLASRCCQPQGRVSWMVVCVSMPGNPLFPQPVRIISAPSGEGSPAAKPDRLRVANTPLNLDSARCVALM